jgi:hypothetical protein
MTFDTRQHPKYLSTTPRLTIEWMFRFISSVFGLISKIEYTRSIITFILNVNTALDFEETQVRIFVRLICKTRSVMTFSAVEL